MSGITPNPNRELQELANNPTTPTWLARLIPTLLDKDPVDVLAAFEIMVTTLRRRLDLFLAIAQAELSDVCQGCEHTSVDLQLVPTYGRGVANYCPGCRALQENERKITEAEARGAYVDAMEKVDDAEGAASRAAEHEIERRLP